ncbi:MAG: hypothetical protein H7287_12620, partial [Thermoleophilia bacterium]|nr:hypothetical protein [Thermoleophilia bacterium]
MNDYLSENPLVPIVFEGALDDPAAYDERTVLNLQTPAMHGSEGFRVRMWQVGSALELNMVAGGASLMTLVLHRGERG